VPVIPNGKPNDRALLALSANGEGIETTIPLQLEVTRTRSESSPNYRPMVRLTKWWAETLELPITSFELELLWAHVLETDLYSLEDVQESLLAFFAYFERSKLSEPIVFTDYYKKSEAEIENDAVTIIDPVNPVNNVAQDMTMRDREQVVQAAEKALDAVRTWRFEPARKDGVPVAVRISVEVNFRLY